MDKREKVLMGLECCMTKNCSSCPYERLSYSKDGTCVDDLHADAYEVMKGHNSESVGENNPCEYCMMWTWEWDCDDCPHKREQHN